jgi:hypothetical protein
MAEGDRQTVRPYGGAHGKGSADPDRRASSAREIGASRRMKPGTIR